MQVADVAIDPDFRENRFVYMTVLASFPTGSRTVNVVRLREVNGSLGEAATIIPDLPVSPEGYPSISVGPDRHIYVAMPAAAGAASRERLYDGYVLRYSRDGSAAGDARTGSPVLAQGSAPQASLVWDSNARPHELRWEGVGDLAQSPAGTRDDGHRLAIVGTIPALLQLATLSAKGEDVQVSAPRLVPLGELVPTAATFGASGDLVVAASHGTEGPVDILLLRQAVSSARD